MADSREKRSCCASQNLIRMLALPDVNDMCRNCGTHWFGREGAEIRYSRAEWDRLLSEPLLPCPFCGSTVAPRLTRNIEFDCYEVICSAMRDHGLGCGSRAAHFSTPGEAKALWQSRAQ